MTNNEKKDIIQKEALSEWIKSGKKSTVAITTGVGKTFIGLHALYEMEKNDSEHYFLAEVVDRKHDVLNQIKDYNKIFNRNVLEDYNLKFSSYQAAKNWRGKNIGLIIADEIHDSLSPKYSKVYFENDIEAVIGLSATIDEDIYYEEIRATKGDLLNAVAPICYSYGLNESVNKGTSRKLNVYIINHELDDKYKIISAGSKYRKFNQTEKDNYKYWDSAYEKLIRNEINYNRVEGENLLERSERLDKLEKVRNLKIRGAIGRRSSLLYDLPSKLVEIRNLLPLLKGKTILFGNGLNSLISLTSNTVSGRNSNKKNQAIIDDFNNDELNLIGSFKKLKQGSNLTKLKNVVMLSYYAKQKDFEQRVGRLRNDGTVGNVFIFRTLNTQEVKWVDSMLGNISSLNVIECKNVNDCITKYNKNE